MGPREPYVGCPVHYQAYGTPGGEFKSVPRAAIITGINPDGTVSLFIMNPTGVFFPQSIVYDAERAPGTWSWMDDGE